MNVNNENINTSNKENKENDERKNDNLNWTGEYYVTCNLNDDPSKTFTFELSAIQDGLKITGSCVLYPQGNQTELLHGSFEGFLQTPDSDYLEVNAIWTPNNNTHVIRGTFDDESKKTFTGSISGGQSGTCLGVRK